MGHELKCGKSRKSSCPCLTPTLHYSRERPHISNLAAVGGTIGHIHTRGARIEDKKQPNLIDFDLKHYPMTTP